MISNIRTYKNEIQAILNKYFILVKNNNDKTLRHAFDFHYRLFNDFYSLDFTCTFNVNDIKDIIKVRQAKRGFLYYFNINDYISFKNFTSDKFDDTFELYYSDKKTLLADRLYYFTRYPTIYRNELIYSMSRYDCDRDVFVKYCFDNETSDSDHSGFESIFNDLYKKDCEMLQEEFRDTVDGAEFTLKTDVNSECKRLFKFFECKDGKTFPVMLIDFDNFKVYLPAVNTRDKAGRREFDFKEVVAGDMRVQNLNWWISNVLRCEKKMSNDYYLS